MWSWQYILSQIFVLLAMITLGTTYLIKNKVAILVLSTVSVFMFALEYFMLGSYTGLAVNLVSVIRGIWFFINEKRGREKDLLSFIIISVFIIIVGIISAKLWADYLAIFIVIIYTYSIWQKSIKVYRYLSVVGSIFWISYNIIYFSLLGLIAESILLIIEIVGIFLLYLNKQKNQSEKDDRLIENKISLN